MSNYICICLQYFISLSVSMFPSFSSIHLFICLVVYLSCEKNVYDKFFLMWKFSPHLSIWSVCSTRVLKNSKQHDDDDADKSLPEMGWKEAKKCTRIEMITLKMMIIMTVDVITIIKYKWIDENSNETYFISVCKSAFWKKNRKYESKKLRRNETNKKTTCSFLNLLFREFSFKSLILAYLFQGSSYNGFCGVSVLFQFCISNFIFEDFFPMFHPEYFFYVTPLHTQIICVI